VPSTCASGLLSLHETIRHAVNRHSIAQPLRRISHTHLTFAAMYPFTRPSWPKSLRGVKDSLVTFSEYCRSVRCKACNQRARSYTVNARIMGLSGALVAFLSSSAGAQTPTVEKARAIVTPFYEALNLPAGKDAVKLIEQATSPDWMTCGSNDACIPRENFIEGFKRRGDALPDVKWEIKEVLIAGDRIIVRGETSGTPSGVFRGILASGKSFKIMSIDIHTIEDGKIERSYHVEDWAGAMRQLSSGN
jgi:predicted ester cyclase